jgi:hypothetical protein
MQKSGSEPLRKIPVLLVIGRRNRARNAQPVDVLDRFYSNVPFQSTDDLAP